MEAPPKRTKLKVVCEYDGSDYSGWASAPTNPKPSIQGAIESSWRKLFPQTQFLAVRASSRTDAGVHALGQVITIESDIEFGNVPVLESGSKLSATERRRNKKASRGATAGKMSNINSEPGTAEEASRRLNSFLPSDIVLRSSKEVSLDFCAKDRSVRRMYRYEILNHPLRSAIGRLYVWHIKHEMDVEMMKQAAELFVGTHDMSCYCPTFYLPEATSKAIKTIESSRLLVSEDGAKITYEVVGSSFMYHQVRNMVGALTEVGRGKMTLDQFKSLLSGGSRVAFAGAPPQGLTLVWIEHSESPQATGTTPSTTKEGRE